MEPKRRANAATAVDDDDMAKPNNPLQSNFEDTSSMDSDERYLVWSSKPGKSKELSLSIILQRAGMAAGE